jgi:hypothetical protein
VGGGGGGGRSSIFGLDVECGEGDKKANEHVIIEKKIEVVKLNFSAQVD